MKETRRARADVSFQRGTSGLAAIAVVVMVLFMSAPLALSTTQASAKIKHVIIIMQENHSFDNYFGTYPGARGLNTSVAIPVSPGSSRMVHPFLLKSAVVSGDPCHGWRCSHMAYNGGKMNGFVYASKSNLTMGYFDHSVIPYYWDYASQFVLLDNYFSSLMGPTTPNRMYLISGQSAGLTYNANLLPNRTSYSFNVRTLMDELDGQHISWKYYTGYPGFYNGFNILPSITSFKENPSRLHNVVPRDQIFTDIRKAKLPGVSWVMPPSDQLSEHPPYNVTAGQLEVVSVVNAVMDSEYWKSTAIFVTWDESGGWYDHVPPPQVDRYGYGFRVPTLIISPYARQGFVDHTLSDHTSILKFVEDLFGLQPLAQRDASASDLMEAFNFNQTPRQPLVLPGDYVPNHYPLTPVASTTFRLTSTAQTHTITTTGRTNANGTVSPKLRDAGVNRSLLILLTVVVGLIFALFYLRIYPRSR